MTIGKWAVGPRRSQLQTTGMRWAALKKKKKNRGVGRLVWGRVDEGFSFFRFGEYGS